MACNDYFQPYIDWLQKNPGPGEVSAFRFWASVKGGQIAQIKDVTT